MAHPLLTTPELVRTTLLVLLTPDRQVQIQDLIEAMAPELDPQTQEWRDAARVLRTGLLLLQKEHRARYRSAPNQNVYGWELIPTPVVKEMLRP